MLDRRNFLNSVVKLTAFTSITRLPVAQALAVAGQSNRPLPPRSLYDRDPEAFWAALRDQYLIPREEVYLNNGTVGSSPRPVLQSVFDSFLETEKMDQQDPEQYPIWGYEAYAAYRDVLAQFVGASRDQIALTRNATESNNYIANGLELKAGD